MTRIGGALSGTDLTIQHNLLRAFAQLDQSSRRLSTMQRINSGRDDPAGLIATEQLRAELVSLEKAVDNTYRAASTIHVADAAMSQTSRLLNTIRGNIITAASSTTSDAERAALQMETDAALEALDRIGNSTSLGGRKLLNGSAGFEISGVNSEQIADIQVHQRGGGEATTIDVEVVSAATTAELSVSAGALSEDTTLEITGNEGTAVVELSEGATAEEIAAAVAATSSSTGVTASVEGGTLTFASTDVGSEARVAVEVIAGSFDTGAGSANGTDVAVVVNGTAATGHGNSVSVHTNQLQVDLTIAAGFTGTADAITVSGSALTMLLGSDPNDTTRLALPRINSNSLGGAAGRLSDLRSGGSASLASGNFAGAMEILNAAGSQIMTARARAGAFERFGIESTREVLNSSIVNISSAISQIADTDVAAESARLVRAMILADAGTSAARLNTSSRQMMGGLLSNLLGR